ncbi:MAG: hypothetical protein OXH52_15610 [Gammaproteobacteria bacterium]|nr:hypothetical protein [Gammaproteobacteria bacterium]
MQDRYTGDVGDFVKYGLLRAITGSKRLGIAWYLHPDAGPAGDGGHTEYLSQHERWQHLDPRLFEALKRIVSDDDRSVGSLQRSGVLGNATFAGKRLDVSAVRWRERRDWRLRWFKETRNQVAHCDVVFADPDNGLVSDTRFRPERKEDAKRIPLAEATALGEGRTAIIYHHNSRRVGGHLLEVRYWMKRLPGCSIAYYWRPWSNRTFFVVNADAEVARQLERFAKRWEGHGELVRQ